jgi:hypothetical protein
MTDHVPVRHRQEAFQAPTMLGLILALPGDPTPVDEVASRARSRVDCRHESHCIAPFINVSRVDSLRSEDQDNAHNR